MGLLDSLQNDPEKLAALRQGLISMGTTMMAGGKQDFGTALGQGVSAGTKTYAEKFDEARKKALAMAPYKAAMTPAKPAVAAAYKAGGASLPQLGQAQDVAQNMYNLPQAANPYKPPEQDMTGEALGMPASLMPQGMGIEDFGGGQPGQIEEVAAQPAQAASFDRNKYLEAVIEAGPEHPLFMKAQEMMFEQPKPIVLGKSLIDPKTNKVIATDETWREEKDVARQQRMDEIRMQLEDKRMSREMQAELRRELASEQAALRRELAAQSSADRMTIAGMMNATRQQKNVPKLPTSALKLQQEELDAIGTAATIQSDLGAIKAQVDSGQLKLGPVNNVLSAGKNWAGISDENSRNYGTFKATLERLRNESLRLNKGVQTEGDSQRAWNELITNINDPKLVSKRLGEIQAINERAANLRKMNVESIRSNFGVESMDTGQYERQPAAVARPTKPKSGVMSPEQILNEELQNALDAGDTKEAEIIRREMRSRKFRETASPRNLPQKKGAIPAGWTVKER